MGFRVLLAVPDFISFPLPRLATSRSANKHKGLKVVLPPDDREHHSLEGRAGFPTRHF